MKESVKEGVGKSMTKHWRKLGILLATVMGVSACGTPTGIEIDRGQTLETKTSENIAGETPDERTVGEPVDYVDAAYLATYGQTMVETEFVTMNPVENIAYVPNNGLIDIYRSGVYCGYLSTANFGQGAWLETPRNEIFRVFGGAHEMTTLRDWALDELNPYLRAVCDYEADVYVTATIQDFIDWGIFESAEDSYRRYLYGWGACFGQENVKWGYVLWVAKEMVDEELLRELLAAMEFTEDSFTEEALEKLNTGQLGAEKENVYTMSELEKMAEEGLVSFRVTDGDLIFPVPDRLVAIWEGNELWGLYTYVRLGGVVRVGQVSARDAAGEEWGTETEIRSVFTDAQRVELRKNPEQEGIADDTCWLTTSVMVSIDGKRVLEMQQLGFGDTVSINGGQTGNEAETEISETNVGEIEDGLTGWQNAAWAEFDDYSPVEWHSDMEYTGFLDRLTFSGEEMPWARISTVYPSGDYDLDGKMDRLYARHTKNQRCDIYLFLSGGGVILLNEKEYLNPLNQYELAACDYTGDSRPEITCSIRISGGTGFDDYKFNVYQEQSGQWEQMRLPGKNLTVKVRVQDETHLKVIQPDFNVGAIYEVPADMIDQMWLGGADRTLAKDWGLAEGKSVLWTDPDTGEPMIRTAWNIVVPKGRCQCAAIGQWAYKDGAWQLRDVLLGGFNIWGMSHFLNVEKTERELADGKTLQDILGWQPKTEIESGEYASLRITSIGDVMINGLIKDNTVNGICEIKGLSDLATERVKLRALNLAGEPYDADIVLYRFVEADQEWLIMEYNGERLYFEDRWNEGKDVERLELNVPEAAGYTPYYIEELDIALNVPDTLYIYRTPGIYTDWEGEVSVLDCAEWILITDKEYTEEYLTGGFAEKLSEEMEHVVYRIELVSRELYPVWNLCAFSETEELYLTADGYCRYYDSVYSVRRKNENGVEEIWLPGVEWTAALMERVEPIVGGYAIYTYILTPAFCAEDDLEEKYWYTMANDIWWQGYTQAVDALLGDPEEYAYAEDTVLELTEFVWEDYREYVQKYGVEGEPELIHVYMDSREDVYLRAHEYARQTAFYAMRSPDKDRGPEKLNELFVVLLEWDNGQRSFALYTFADELYQMSYPEARYQNIGGSYDYMVDLQTAYDYMREHSKPE